MTVVADGGLRRGLGRLDVVSLTLNTIVGAGIFGLPAALAATAGHLSLAVLLAAFVLVVLLALCTVEVASRFDVTGGPVYYASAAFGAQAGFVVGWLMYLSRLAAFGAIASIMLDYAGSLWPVVMTPAGRALAITLTIALLALFNLRSVLHGAWASNLLLLAKAVPLLLLAFAGLWLAGWRDLPAPAPISLGSLSDGLLIAFFACMGFEQAAVVAGEVRNPRRDLPTGIMGGVAAAGLLYALLMFASFATVPDLANSRQPLAEVAASLIGPVGATLVSVTAILSCAGGLSVSILVTPRVLYALARQGDLPAALARIHASSLVPGVAIAVTAGLLWALTVSGTFIYLATFAVIARMLMYASTCAALIRLRRRDGAAPLPIKGGPLLALIAIASCGFALVTATGTAVRDVLLALAAGFVLRAWVRSGR